MSFPNECHGDEDEIEFEYRMNRELKDEIQADEWLDDPDNW